MRLIRIEILSGMLNLFLGALLAVRKLRRLKRKRSTSVFGFQTTYIQLNAKMEDLIISSNNYLSNSCLQEVN